MRGLVRSILPFLDVRLLSCVEVPSVAVSLFPLRLSLDPVMARLPPLAVMVSEDPLTLTCDPLAALTLSPFPARPNAVLFQVSMVSPEPLTA